MDKLTVSLEVAKRLKEAGWKHETYFELSPKGHMWPTGEFLKFHTGSQEVPIGTAPTASEIAEVLPVHTTAVKGNGRYDVSDYSTQTEAIAPTMADALAELWIKLQEVK